MSSAAKQPQRGCDECGMDAGYGHTDLCAPRAVPAQGDDMSAPPGDARAALEALQGALGRYVCPVAAAHPSAGRCESTLSETSWCPGCALETHLPALARAVEERDALHDQHEAADLVREKLLRENVHLRAALGLDALPSPAAQQEGGDV